MKISQQPTNHILIKATTNSHWDNCDFAIVACGEKWKERLKSQIEFTSLADKNGDLASVRYYDGSTSFYTSQDDEVEKLLSTQGEGRQWAFVELEENEEETFTVPESRLEASMLSIDRWGSGKYIAYGKYISKEFYTETISFKEILKQYGL